MSEEVEGRETVLGVSRCVIVGVIRRINSDPYYYNGNRTEILSYRCQDDWQTLSFDRLVRSYFKKIPNWSIDVGGKLLVTSRTTLGNYRKSLLFKLVEDHSVLLWPRHPQCVLHPPGSEILSFFTETVPEILYITVICRPIWSSSVSFTLKQLF